MKHKQYDDDDGRVIADMSGIERDNLFLPRLPKRKKNTEEKQSDADKNDLPQLSDDQRRAFFGGALSAALLIALIFIAAAAIVIFLITRIP